MKHIPVLLLFGQKTVEISVDWKEKDLISRYI